MAWIILLLFIGGPLLELSVLIDVGGEIGAVPTVLLCILTAAIGLSLVRLQGLKVLSNMQQASQTGEPVGENLIHGFFLLVSGVCLFIPGFVTDAFGGLLLIPFVRLALGKAGLASMMAQSSFHGNWSGSNKQSGSYSYKKTTIIDGEFYEESGHAQFGEHKELTEENPNSGDGQPKK